MSDSPAPAGRTFEHVLSWIEGRILTGELTVGDQLPSERDLAHQLGVGRPAVREAVRSLQAQGVLRSAVGAGKAGGTTVTAVPGRALLRLLRLHVALANFGVDDLLDARIALERLSVRLACEHATADDLAAIEAQIDLMDANRADKAAFNDADTAFHVAIAEAGGNKLVADLTVAIRESVRLPLLDSFRVVIDWEQITERLQRDHRAIYAAIADRDPDAGEQAVEEHIRSAWRSLKRGAPASLTAN